mgnify:CR=1 FL=1|tara:strand:- start:243200 stop:244912 length:1713 start_codon:yes stop_codon:yes gene_type:complete
MKLRFIWLVSFTSINLIGFTAFSAETSETKPDYSFTWGDTGSAPAGKSPIQSTPSNGDLLGGSNVEHTAVNTSKYQDKELSDFASTPSAAAGAVPAGEANVKLDIAKKFAILNKANCESITGSSAGPSAAAASAANLAGAQCQKLRTLVQSCDTVFTGAIGVSNLCHTEKNESISSSVTMIQGIMGAASGLVDSCNDFGKAMNIAQKGMTAYTLACGAAQVACKMKCGGAKASVDTYMANSKILLSQLVAKCSAEAAANTINSASITAHCKVVANTINSFVETAITQDNSAPFGVRAKAEICVLNVPALLTSGFVGIASFAQAEAKSKQCKEDAEAKKAAEIAKNSCENVANKDRADCACTIAANKNLSYCATGLVDCGLSENADKPLCICKANPRMAGCEGVSTSIATNSALNTSNGSGLTTSKGTGNLSTAPTAAADATNLFPNKKGNGQDGIGSTSSAGGASGAGLDAGASGGGATDKTNATTAATKDSANILDSGSGGGGGYRGMAGSYSLPEYRNRLKAFANKNGIGAKVAGSSWSDQVTATGGKSNFDKVKTRLQENKSTLLSK